MDIIQAAFSSAALSARTITVITTSGDNDPKTRRPPGLAQGGLFYPWMSPAPDRN
jgi:hypothetical protein